MNTSAPNISNSPELSIPLLKKEISPKKIPPYDERDKVFTPSDICTFCHGALDPSDLVYDVNTCRVAVWCKSCKNKVPFGKLTKKVACVQPPIVKVGPNRIKREKIISTHKRRYTHSFFSLPITTPQNMLNEKIRRSIRRERMHQCSLCPQAFTQRFDWIVHVKSHFGKK